MRHAAAAAMLVIAAGAARADEVVLRNGARFEGQIRETDKTVTVVMDFGSMTFKKIDVARIDRGPSALAEFDAKILELKADDLDGRYQLAVWAKQRGLDHRARRLLEDILARNPDHAGAREGLGQRRVGDRWLTEDEVKAEQGLVLFRGEWVKRETADDIRKIEAERAAEIAKIVTIEEMRLKAAKIEADALVALEEARARAQAEYDDTYYRLPIFHPSFGFPGFRCRPGRILHFGNAVIIPPGKPTPFDVRKPTPFVRKLK